MYNFWYYYEYDVWLQYFVTREKLSRIFFLVIQYAKTVYRASFLFQEYDRLPINEIWDAEGCIPRLNFVSIKLARKKSASLSS